MDEMLLKDLTKYSQFVSLEYGNTGAMITKIHLA